MRELATQIVAILDAAGYEEIDVEEPGRVTFASRDAMAPGSRPVVIVGNSRDITDTELKAAASFVVVQDHAPQVQVERLTAVTGDNAHVLTCSAFIDRVWNAGRAIRWATEQAQTPEASSMPPRQGTSRTGRLTVTYVTPEINDRGSGDRVSSQLLSWVDGDRDALGAGMVVVTGEAGLGKSELTRALLRRSITTYQNRSRDAVPTPPPLALRVPLRAANSLEIRAIRDHLVREAELSSLTETLLLMLLKRQRLILLLDGLDEITMPSEELEGGYERLQELVGEGAQILLTSRSSARKSRSVQHLLRKVVTGPSGVRPLELELAPFDPEGACGLLTACGATEPEARRIANGLPEELKGTPLYLLWSFESGAIPESPQAVHAIRELINGVCARESTRRGLAMSADEQVEVLQAVALGLEDGAVTAELLVDGAIGDADSHFITGPHALLEELPEVGFRFRHQAFHAVLLAHALSQYWADAKASDFQQWLLRRFGAHALDSLTTEYLSQLLTSSQLADAWEMLRLAPARFNPHARRNILAVALCKASTDAIAEVDDRGAKAPRVKPETLRALHTEALERCIPDRTLSGCHLDGLEFVQFSFAGWELERLRAEGADFEQCDFTGAIVDHTIWNANLGTSHGLRPAP